MRLRSILTIAPKLSKKNRFGKPLYLHVRVCIALPLFLEAYITAVGVGMHQVLWLKVGVYRLLVHAQTLHSIIRVANALLIGNL
jgi:hypothetical protein